MLDSEFCLFTFILFILCLVAEKRIEIEKKIKGFMNSDFPVSVYQLI